MFVYKWGLACPLQKFPLYLTLITGAIIVATKSASLQGEHFISQTLSIVESIHIIPFKRFSTLLRTQDRAKCGKGGGHRTENRYTGRGGHRTYLIEVGTLHTLLGWGHRTCLIGLGTPYMPYWGGDTAHSLLGWGHRTTLKEISLSTKFQVYSALPSDG